YQEALDTDATQPLIYFKRAAVYLSKGRSVAALADLNQALQLNPNFEPALTQRGKLLTRRGQFGQARADWEHLQKLASATPPSEEAQKALDQLQTAERGFENTKAALEAAKYSRCVQTSSDALKIATQMTELYELRADCYLRQGNAEKAVADYSRAVQIDSSQLAVVRKVSQLYYFIMYQPTKAIAAIKICLNSDPDNKACKAIFRQIKKIEKQIQAVEKDYSKNKFNTAAKTLTAFHLAQTKRKGEDETAPQGLIQELEGQVREVLAQLGVPADLKKSSKAADGAVPERLLAKLHALACRCFAGFKKNEPGVTWCTSALDLSPNDAELLLLRADMYLALEDGEKAFQDLNRAKDQQAAGTAQLNTQQQRELQQKLHKAQQLQRQAQRKDYYKILDVPKDATQAQIKKAYRKLAQKWHPDLYNGDLSEAEVNAKMGEINLANEILSDEEKRSIFDQGGDPADPTGNNGAGGGGHGGEGGFHHFAGGFNPFGGGGGGGGGFPFEGFTAGGGGGQQFKFHF
ncbi:hypothetical protein BJ085DRAFT_4434, partial [Dimargaris cristalligena]